MEVLAHFRKNELEQILTRLINLKQDFSMNKFGVERELLGQLNLVESFFKQIGNTTNESKVSGLRIYLSISISGINPETLEVVKNYKRKVVQASTFHCLSSSSLILENELLKIDELLDNGYNTLTQLVLSALQSKAIKREEINEIENLSQIEELWNRLISSYEQISIINTKLKTEMLSQDIILILDKVLLQIRR